MTLTCISIETPDPAFLTLEATYEGGFVEIDTLRPYASQPEYDLPERFLNHKRAMNDECFAIRTGDTLAAYGWYSARPNHFADDLTLHFGPEWVYMHRGFTHPAHRGQRLHAIGMTMALAAYRQRGFKGLISCVEAGNTASLKSCYRMGYRRFGTIYAVRLGRLLGRRRLTGRLLRFPIVYCTPGCQTLGFRLERNVGHAHVGGAPQPFKV